MVFVPMAIDSATGEFECSLSPFTLVSASYQLISNAFCDFRLRKQTVNEAAEGLMSYLGPYEAGFQDKSLVSSNLWGTLMPFRHLSNGAYLQRVCRDGVL
jgi:hypothetical protein